MQSNYRKVLVLEDDAYFCNDFSRTATSYFKALPSDWDQAFLGGELEPKRRLPEKLNDQVYRAFGVILTHAFAIQGDYIKLLRDHLARFEGARYACQFHVDSRIAQMHRNRIRKIYIPTRWIVGQAEGFSDVSEVDSFRMPLIDQDIMGAT